MLSIWTAINTLLSLLTASVVYLLIRQIGVLSQRLGHAAARPTTQGPRHGENVEFFVDRLSIVDKKPTLFVFGSKSCPICKIIADAANQLATKWQDQATIVLVYERMDNSDEYVTKYSNCLVRFDTEMRATLNVGFVPFAMKTTCDRTVVATGLVNNISHLESLLEAVA